MYSQDQQYKIVQVDFSSSTQVNAGASTTDQLQPTDGYIYKILQIYQYAPAPVGATSGTHTMEVYYQNIANSILEWRSAFGSTIYCYQNGLTGGTYELPSVTADQMKQIYELYASYDVPLNFKYSNGTDANQTGSRVLYLTVLKTREAL